MAAFSLGSSRGGQRAGKSSGLFLFLQGTNSTTGPHPPDFIKLPPKVLISKPQHFGLQHVNFVGNKHPAHSSLSATGRSDFSILSNCFRLFPQLDWKLPEEQTVTGRNCVLTCLVITSPIYYRLPKSLYSRVPRLHLSSVPKEVSVFSPVWASIAWVGIVDWKES